VSLLRKVFIYKKTETTMDQLRPGDIFSLEKADVELDVHVDPLERYFVESDLPKDEGDGNWSVRASRLVKDPDFDSDVTAL